MGFWVSGFGFQVHGKPKKGWFKVELAKALLAWPELAIADIASAHQSYLNRHFKRPLGVAPGQWQQQ